MLKSSSDRKQFVCVQVKEQIKSLFRKGGAVMKDAISSTLVNKTK